MSEGDALLELHELARALRVYLEQLRRAGVVTVPAGARVPAGAGARVPAGARHASHSAAPAHAPAVAAGPLPSVPGPRAGLAPDAIPGTAAGGRGVDVGPGTMSAALAELLGESSTRTPRQPVPAAAAPRLQTLAEVRADLGDCQRCKLAGSRHSIVFGTGDPDASLMFVGEAPGEQEDLRGEPFVGPAGKLLDKMIAAMGWSRQSVYIANVLKCRPPGNRDPQADEIAACKPFLERQIAAVRPVVIVALGRPAAQLLLNTTEGIRSLRGRFHSYRGINVMPTFHPAYLLRNEEHKREAWDDLKKVIAELEQRGVHAPAAPRR